MKNPVTKFPPGSKWLYLRIYGGPQALEEWLTGPFMNQLGLWKLDGLVEQFYFIHFLDPEYQLRLRFLLANPVSAGILMTSINTSCAGMLEEDLLWKIEAGTYEPEYERYGVESMAAVEQWFEIDSMFWLEEIRRTSNADDAQIWKSAIRSVNFLMNDFGLDLDNKIKIINRLKVSGAAALGLSKTMRGQLDDKYRLMADEIGRILSDGDREGDQFWQKRSEDAAATFAILHKNHSDPEALLGSGLVPDLIHMSLNRAFRTRHRIQEQVVYDFMSRFYESQKARWKVDT